MVCVDVAMREKVQLHAFVYPAVKKNAEHIIERMDAINKRITTLSIFKMERCFLLTLGRPCRDRNEGEEDNKDREITKYNLESSS